MTSFFLRSPPFPILVSLCEEINVIKINRPPRGTARKNDVTPGGEHSISAVFHSAVFHSTPLRLVRNEHCASVVADSCPMFVVRCLNIHSRATHESVAGVSSIVYCFRKKPGVFSSHFFSAYFYEAPRNSPREQRFIEKTNARPPGKVDRVVETVMLPRDLRTPSLSSLIVP